jgi:hypothetical protein
MEQVVSKRSKYIFQHRATKARLSFEAESDQEAIMTLGRLCQTVMDWDMRKFRLSKNKRKKLKNKQHVDKNQANVL